jgi:hypothetical protein
MAEHDPEFRPLAHISGRDDRHWYLAMAHGFFYGKGGGRRRYVPASCVTPAAATSPSVTTMSRPTSGRAGGRLSCGSPDDRVGRRTS